MDHYQWEGITQFIFPESVGSIDEVISVKVKPQWQQVETEDSLRLIGIYHIQSVIRFNSKKLPNYSEGILIEHLDFDGDEGYFEYAYPLEVDLPKELVGAGKPKLEVSNVQFFVLDGSCCTFRWDVQCIIEDEKSEPVQQQPNIFESSSSKSFEQSVQIPEHIEDKQYELNLESMSDQDNQEDVLNQIDVEINTEATSNLKPVEQREIEKEQRKEKKIAQEKEIENVESPQHRVKEIETVNILHAQDSQLIHEGYISNVPQEAFMANEPLIIKGKQLTDGKEKESDDFLESLREDYTVFNVSNNILRK